MTLTYSCIEKFIRASLKCCYKNIRGVTNTINFSDGFQSRRINLLVPNFTSSGFYSCRNIHLKTEICNGETFTRNKLTVRIRSLRRFIIKITLNLTLNLIWGTGFVFNVVPLVFILIRQNNVQLDKIQCFLPIYYYYYIIYFL